MKILPRKATGFIVNLEVKETCNGRGIGIFAAQFIPKNTRIDDGNSGRSFNEEELIAFIEGAEDDTERRWWLEHMYGNEGMMWLNMDDLDTMMVNHCENPTTVMLPHGDFTTRDVNIGEEITENYNHFQDLPSYGKLCKKYGAIDFDPDWK